ncbi:uncharacterized protein LOC107677865 [Sinocyclocheilus anshuiensis]|uniref:uncharacterized protein LOC107677865 n=1 Tax=Sinocyclocheilus anshuiensis TaxID=1608454 RepID=UPI0007B8A303|nr:PREDICTED: uncharacterized protein LOC107677865 [Sinocyclocheilus anshuiensis]
MRRKTKAQRIFDYENEEDEEEEQKADCFSNGAQKRRKMFSSKEKAEENSSSDAGLQKLTLDMKVWAFSHYRCLIDGFSCILTEKTDSKTVLFGFSQLFHFITPELLERCNTGTTAQKLTNDLLRGLYERECLASHSISGVVYNKRGQPKPALPTEEVQAILRTVQYFFPGKTDVEIKGYIRQKLQNEAKRLRKKPSLSGQYESRGLNLPLDVIDQN